MMNKPELLAPGGSLAKLKIAIEYGADAVYIGGEAFSLRTAAENFTVDEIREGIEFAHARGKKVYLTANILPHNDDINEFDVDAVVVYEAKDDIEKLNGAVNSLVAEGKSVIATKAVPANIKYKQLYMLCESGVKAVENNA